MDQRNAFLKINREKNVNGGGKWNFKIPSVMDVVDRVFIGSDEQTSSTTVEPKKTRNCRESC